MRALLVHGVAGRTGDEVEDVEMGRVVDGARFRGGRRAQTASRGTGVLCGPLGAVLHLCLYGTSFPRCPRILVPAPCKSCMCALLREGDACLLVGGASVPQLVPPSLSLVPPPRSGHTASTHVMLRRTRFAQVQTLAGPPQEAAPPCQWVIAPFFRQGD